jgi:DNA-binding response OmpR family regulator
MKLLVVEDEVSAAAYLRRGLSEEGFALDMAMTGEEASAAVDIYSYDVILLDAMLPVTDGFTLCRRWRASGVTTPILFLTARDDITDRVRGLDLGADDYLVKPYAFEELLARIRVLLRRGPSVAGTAVIEIADLVLDTAQRRVSRFGNVIPLTAREYQLLEYMAHHAGEIVTRTALWEHVWESGMEPDSNVVDVYVRYLRNKLGRDRHVIETVRGMGYILRRQKDSHAAK